MEKTIIKNKLVYESTECNFETVKPPNGEESYCIWFKYTNGSGGESSTPKISIEKDCIKDLADYWKELGLI